MPCPKCGARFLRREPARLACPACGAEVLVLDAPDRAYALQRQLDVALAPVSAECRKELNPSPPDWTGILPTPPARRLLEARGA